MIHSNFLDRYSRLDSPIHRLPALVKLTAAMAMILALVLLPVAYAPYLALPAAALIVVAAVSRVPAGFLLRRLVLLETFVLGVAVLTLLQPDGLRLTAVLVARCTLCLATMILLSNTTPFSEMLRILRALRFPAIMITTLALMYRYLFVLADEAQRMRRARMCRTFVTSRGRHWHALGSVISQLFVRASERAERIYSAMCARGWR
jgi:cobalt/nickel transport system permease protein